MSYKLTPSNCRVMSHWSMNNTYIQVYFGFKLIVLCFSVNKLLEDTCDE
jgi:hypothetical protein